MTVRVAGAKSWISLSVVAFNFCFMGSLMAQQNAPLERIAVIGSHGKEGTLDHLFVDSASARLFLANEINDTLDVIDLDANRLLAQVPGQAKAHSVVYVPGIERIFVGNGSGNCTVLNGKSHDAIKTLTVPGADSVRYDPRTGHVLVASQQSLTVIDSKTLEPVSTVKLPGSPRGFQVAKNQPRAYINVQSPNQVAIVDTDKNQLVGTHVVTGDHKGIGPLVLDEPNRRILVGTRTPARLAVLDLETGKETASTSIGDGPDDMFLDANLKLIFVTCSSGSISVIRQKDADHYDNVATVSTIKGAKTSYYDPVKKRLYVAVPRVANAERPEIWVYQARL